MRVRLGTTNDVIAALSKRLVGEQLTLDRDLAGVSGWQALWDSAVGQALVLGAAKLAPAADGRGLLVTGHASLFGVAGSTVSCAFHDDNGGVGASLSVGLTGAALTLPGAASFGVEDAGFTLNVPAAGVPLMGDVHGTLRAGTLALPACVRMPSEEGGWVIEGTFSQIALAGLDALTALTGAIDLDGAVPTALGDLERSLALRSVRVRCNSASGLIDLISMTVSSAADWPIMPGRVVLRSPVIRFTVTDPADATLRDLTVRIDAAVVAGSAPPVPVALEKRDAAVWALRIPATELPLPSLSTLLELVGDAGLHSALPQGFATSGGIALTSFELAVDARARSVAGFAVTFAADQEFSLPGLGALAVRNAALSVSGGAGSGIAAGFSGTLALGGIEIDVSGDKSADQAAWTRIEGSLRKGVTLPIDSVVKQVLPAVQAPALTIDALTLALLPADHAVSLSAALHGPWTLPIAAGAASVDGLGFDISGGAAGLTGRIRGTAHLGKTDFHVDCTLAANELRVHTSIPTIALSDLLLPFGLPLPAGVPDVSFHDVVFDVSPNTGDFSIQGSVARDLILPPGGGLRLTRLDFAAHRKAGSGADAQPDQLCSLTLAIGQLRISDQLEVEAFELTMTSRRGAEWTAAGKADATLYGQPFTLEASYKDTPQATRLAFVGSLPAETELLRAGDVAGLSVHELTLAIVSSKTEPAPAADSAAGFSIRAEGGVWLELGTVKSNLGGALTLQSADNTVSLVFEPDPDRGKITVPLGVVLQPQAAPPSLLLDFRSLSISRSDGVVFSAAVDLSIAGAPAVQAVLPADPIRTTLRAGGGSIELTADPIMAPVILQVPPIERSGQRLDLGEATLFANKLLVQFGKAVSIGADLAVGLPAGINCVFGVATDGSGKPAAEPFRTWDPAQPEENLFVAHLDVGTDGVSFAVQSSPFRAIEVDQGWLNFDFGAFGRGRLRLPTLKLEPAKSAFEAEVDWEMQELGLPLAPLQALLQALKLDAAARLLPQRLPFMELDAIDAHGNLRDEELIKLLDAMAGSELPGEVKQMIRDICAVGDRLPDGLKQYFRMKLPPRFKFSAAVTTTGGVRFDIGVPKGDDPVRFLFPALAGPVPELVGVELHGMAFGELFGGALLLLQVDARIDRFDLVTLLGSIALGDQGSPVLPASSHTLKRRLIVDKLFMPIIYQAGVPIPIPLFYDQLGVEYWGLEGLQAQGHISLPMPQFDLMATIRLVGAFKEFFLTDGYLDEDAAPGGMDVRFSTGINHIALPAYLGGAQVGDAKAPGPEVSAYRSIAKLLNTLKRVIHDARELTVNDLIGLVALDDRVGTATIGFAGLSAEGAWALTTPREFAEVAYARLGLAHERVSDAVAVLPASATPNEQGLCLFLKGGFVLGPVAALEAVFGLAAADSGLGTGFLLHGSIANTVGTELGGRIIIAPKATPPFDVAGHAQLSVLDRQVLLCDVSLSADGLRIQGLLDVFSSDAPMKLAANLIGYVGKDGILLAGDAQWTVGRTFTLAGARARLDNNGLSIAGTWLNQTLTFALVRIDKQVGGQTMAGLRASADLTPLAIGDVFRVTGGGPGGGPHASFELVPGAVPDIALSGRVLLLGIEGGADIRLSDAGFAFHLDGNLLGLFSCALDVAAGSLVDGGGFMVTVCFTGTSLEHIADRAPAALVALGKDAAKELDRARAGINAAQQLLNQAIDGIQSQLAAAQRRVSRLNATIARIDRQIAALKKRGTYVGSVWIPDPLALAQIAALGTQRTAVVGEQAFANATLTTVRTLLSWAQTGTGAITGVLSFALRSLKDQVDAARRELQAAQTQYDQVRRRLGKRADLAEFTGTPLVVHAVFFTASVTRVKGVAVDLKADVTFLRQRSTHEFRCALSSPADVASGLAHSLV